MALQRANPTAPGSCGESGSRAARQAAAVFAAVLFAGLALAALSLPAPHTTLTRLVRSALPESGVQNPVTAVLLNFRGYDTLLEVAVLLLAAVAAQAAGRARAAPMPPPSGPANMVLSAFLRLAAPLMIVVAGYVLWVGKHAPGGAFQSGSILAAAGVLATLASRFSAGNGTRRQAFALVLGPLTFGAVGLGTMAGGGAFLQYPRDWAGALILLVESAAAVSIAMALLVLFAACLAPGAAGAAAPGAEAAPPRRTGTGRRA